MARVLIAGAGALGSVFGGFLRVAGHQVALLGRAAHLDVVAGHGLRIDGLWGEHRAAGFRIARDAEDLQGGFDAVLITVKSYDTRAMARAVAPRLAPRGVVLSLQNGLGNVEAIADAVGTRVLAGRVIFGAEMVAPGWVRVTVYADPVLIGVPRCGASARLEAQAHRWASRVAAAGIPASFCEDIEAALWGKVLYNAALNPLGALLGVHYGALSDNPHTRAIMDTVLDEAFAVAVAEGVRLPWTSVAEYRRVFYSRLVPATFHHRSSMLQDLERGRPTEIDAINGEVWKRGAARGMVTAANELLTRLVHARAAGGRDRTTMRVTITQASLDAIHAHARDAYPDECCGLVITREGCEEVIRVTNIQDQLHAKYPEEFPRTARLAYHMGPEHVAFILGAARGELEIRAFYHSHPDHESYFSAEDRTQALGGADEPGYPQAGQIVVSVSAGRVNAVRAFGWDPAARDFTEAALTIG